MKQDEILLPSKVADTFPIEDKMPEKNLTQEMVTKSSVTRSPSEETPNSVKNLFVSFFKKFKK